MLSRDGQYKFDFQGILRFFSNFLNYICQKDYAGLNLFEQYKMRINSHLRFEI